MHIERAGSRDIRGLARVRWRDRSDHPADDEAFDSFVSDLSSWWETHHDTHSAFVARTDDGVIIGAAWVALLPRVPSPGSTSRLSADIQSVFVVPEHRGEGLGTALVDAASRHAEDAGALRITVHSSARAVSLYRRLQYAGSPTLLQRTAEA
ncbi:GNAT family N-acetyltransferase [Microbacterium phyllosphaerae]|uniref:GNAT family N-acetyltransferase n=1 Tax=Microbacterium phyllosphaerae TaxID=124798 RepID=UPI0027DC2022|nr:GNAT family N-acetyltransferase [Microbacterium phyllosphaerae]